MSGSSAGRAPDATYDGRSPNDHGPPVGACTRGAYDRSPHHAPDFGGTPVRASSQASISAVVRGRSANVSSSGTSASASSGDNPLAVKRELSRAARSVGCMASRNDR